MKLSGVHHVSLNVHDTDEVGKFYTEVLGLEKLPRPDFGIPGMWLRSGNQEIHLIEVKEHEAPSGYHFAFKVEDIEQTIEELTAKGVKVSEPRGVPNGGRQSFFKDPAGNMIEINQPV